MRIKALFGLSYMVVMLLCLCIMPSTNAASVEDNVLQVENSLVKAFNEKDFNLMSSLYWHSTKTQMCSPNVFSEDWNPSASLAFPMVLSKGWDSIESILKGYCEQSKGGYEWSLRDAQVTMLADDIAQVVGYHDLVKTSADGDEASSASLRFTHIVQKIDKNWRIVHSHETRQREARQPIGSDGEPFGDRSVEPPGAGMPPGPGLGQE